MQAIQIRQSHPSTSTPADLGFEVLRQLAARGIAPTPEAYRELYEEIAGDPSHQLKSVLARFGKHRLRTPCDTQDAASRVRALEARVEQLNELVREDQLTGCLNRRGLDDMLARELGRADRRSAPLCVAMLDLDNFKHLNDTYGHCVGDAVLVHLAQVIRQTVRSMDSVARFGGEEFLLLLPDTTLEAADLALTRLQQHLAAQVFAHLDHALPITFSAGIARRAAGEDSRSLIARADSALYQAKQAGKNRVANAA